MKAISAAFVFLFACSGEYDVRIQVVPPELVEEANFAEVGVVPSCQGNLDEGPILGTPVMRFALADTPPALGASETGPRGLYARLINSRCEVVASGCSPVNLSAEGSDILRVIVRETAGNSCAANERCMAGACIAGNPEAGVGDGSVGDTPTSDTTTSDAGAEDAARPDAPPSDGDTPDAVTPDAGALPVDTTCWTNVSGCDWSENFGLNVGTSPALPDGAVNAAFTPNGCAVLFSVSRDLFIARRSSPGDAFGDPEELPVLSTNASEDKVIFAPGELEALVVRRVDDDAFVFRATRPSTADDFGDVTQVLPLNRIGFNSYDISLSGDGLRLYMGRPRNALSSQDILVATRTSRVGEFEEPVVVEELSDFDLGEAEPVVSADGRTIVIATTRDADSRLRLYYATRADPSGSWGPLRTLPGEFLNQANEREGALSPDGCELLVNRGGSLTRLVHAPSSDR